MREASAYIARHQRFAFSAITRYQRFCEHSRIFAVSDPVLDRAADLWVAAHRDGRPRNDADLLIAATALEHDLLLVTGNVAHFSWISGLRVEDWRQR